MAGAVAARGGGDGPPPRAPVLTGSELKTLLAGTPLRGVVDDPMWERWAAAFETRTYRFGDEVHDGEEGGSALYVVAAGRIHVLRPGAAEEETTLGTLTRGDYFGVEALFGGPTSAATYRAASDVTVWRLSGADAAPLIDGQPPLRRYIDSHLSDAALRSFIRRCSAFSPFNWPTLRRFLDAFEPVTATDGAVVVRQGDDGDGFYLIRSGRAEVLQRGPETEEPSDFGKSLGFLGSGDFFGELALLTDQPRAATVIARTSLSMFKVSKEGFQQLLRETPQVKDAILGVAAGYSTDAKEMLFGPAEPPRPVERSREEGVGGGKVAGETGTHPGSSHHPFVAADRPEDTGIACLAMVARRYNLEPDMQQLRALANVTRTGATMYSLAEAAELIGLRTRGLMLDAEEVRGSREGPGEDALAEMPLPAVAQMKEGGFVLLQRVSRRDVLLADPLLGMTTLERAEFDALWSGTLMGFTAEPEPIGRRKERTGPSFTRYLRTVLEQRGALGRVLLASVFIQMLGLAVPLFTQHIVDRIVVQGELALLNMLLAGMVLAAATQAGVEYGRQRVLSRTVRRIDGALLMDFFRHLFRLPLRYFDDRKIGDILARIDENEKIRGLLTATTLSVVMDVMTIAVYAVLMLTYSVKLTLAAALFIPLFALITVAATPRMFRYRRAAFFSGAEMQSYIVEAITGIGTVKAMNAEQPVRWQWEQRMRKYLGYSQSASLVAAAARSLAQFVQVAGSAFLLWYGARLVMAGGLTMGQLMAFNVLAGTAVQPMLRIVGLWTEFQQARVAVERLDDVYGTPGERRAEHQGAMPPIRGSIRFDNVSFRYHDGERDVLQNIDVAIAPGQTVALLGRSGSGKTTLVNMLLRLYEPTEGRVLIDGVDVAEVAPSSLRRQIGVVLQDNFMFSGTIRENIALNDPNSSGQDVITAAMLAGVHEFVSELPDGYDTVIGPQGISLSGGQMQRLAIARALYFKPRILVLDEATSALDPESEQIIQQNLGRILHDRTTLIIAHRLSTVRHADLILVMDRGVIVERGTHDELMQRRGLYYHLSSRQLRVG